MSRNYILYHIYLRNLSFKKERSAIITKNQTNDKIQFFRYNKLHVFGFWTVMNTFHHVCI